MAQDRSPKSPRNSLSSMVVAVSKLFTAAKRAPISRESAANALGYSGLTGSSMTLLASLSGYGLIQRRGQDIAVSERAISILHPTTADQKQKAIKEAALAPPLFAKLAEDFLEVGLPVLTSKLVQMGFAPDSAKKTASVFLDNVDFAGLVASDASMVDGEDFIGNDSFEPEEAERLNAPVASSPQRVSISLTEGKRVLASYKIPLGANEAELVFSGESLEIEDFDALIDYVEIFKKQFERKKKQENPSVETQSKTAPPSENEGHELL